MCTVSKLCFFTSPIKQPTREGDVESLVGDGEVRQEADLSRVVPKEAGAKRRRQRGARQPPEGLREAAVLRHQQMIVRALQVERVEGELDTCVTEGRGSGQKRISVTKATRNTLRQS